MIKIDDRIFLHRLRKTVLPTIAKDVASKHLKIEEDAILKSQQFELIYA